MGGDAGGEDMFAQMLAQMTGGAGGAAGGAGAGMFGGMGAGGNPFAAMAGGGGGGGPGAPPTSPFPPQPKTLLDRVFPLVHLLSMIGLALYAVMYLEPARKAGLYGWTWTGLSAGIDWRAWGSLAGHKPAVMANNAANVVGLGISEVVSRLDDFSALWADLVAPSSRYFGCSSASS